MRWPRSSPPSPRRWPPATPSSSRFRAHRRCAGLDLGEVLGVSDIPGGVVNLLSGRTAELVPALAAHRDVNAIIDATGDPELAVDIDRFAAETLKRTIRGEQSSLQRLEALTELRTVWHPIGA